MPCLLYKGGEKLCYPQKFLKNLEITYGTDKCAEIYNLCTKQKDLENISVTDFQDLFAVDTNNF